MLNAGRVHTLEKVLYLIPEVVPFVLLGTNIECLALYVTFNSIQGSFQHSNVNVRLGPLNYFFSMAELHRWHHSKIVAESDHNFGNNLLVWDWVFGTWYLPRGRKVSHLGLLSGDYPQAFFRQSVRHAIYPPGAAESTGPPVAFTRKPGNLVRSQ